MRRFIVLGHDVPVEPGIELDDLPGRAGRLDILCRCVTSTLLHSHGIRTGSEFMAIHQDQLAIRFNGATIRQLRPDERSTAARFDAALTDAANAIGHVEVESAPGISVSRRSLTDILETVETPIVQLHPGGDPITSWDAPDNVTCVLSDHHPFSDVEETTLAEVADQRLSLGTVALHADQAITVVHNYLDTNGYRAYDTS